MRLRRFHRMSGRLNRMPAGGAVPVANFSGTPLTGAAPLSVQFTDVSINSPTAWLWDITPVGGDFEGGSTKLSQNPQYAFADVGDYQITLTATNVLGSDVEVKAAYITVT